jgi:hypothetical protein
MPLWHCMPLLLSRQFHIISHHFTNCELLQYFLLVEYRGNPLGWAYHSPPFPWCHLSDWEEGHSISSSETRWPSWLRCSCMSCEVASWCILICINMYQYVSCFDMWHAKLCENNSTFKGWQSRKMRRAAQHENSSTSPSSFALSLPFVSLCGGWAAQSLQMSSNEFNTSLSSFSTFFHHVWQCFTAAPILDPSNGLHGLTRHGLRNVRAATE